MRIKVYFPTPTRILWNELRKSLEALLEIKTKNLFKGQGLQAGNTSRQYPECFEEEC